MQEKILGVLGGVGPLATVYFMDMLVKMTDAQTDQEHIPVLCFNHATIPTARRISSTAHSRTRCLRWSRTPKCFRRSAAT